MFFEHCVDGIAMTDETGNVIEFNASMARITGLDAKVLLGLNLFSCSLFEPSREQGQAIRKALATDGIWCGEAVPPNTELVSDHQSRHCPLRINAVHDEQGRVVMLIWTLIRDACLQQHQIQLIHLAHHDPLTGLPNRRALMARLTCLLDKPERATPGAVLYLDVDRFKQINDAFGHKAGDDLLRAIAVRLRTGLRRTDMVARLGGDEFVIVLERIAHEKDAAVVAAHVSEAFRAPFELSAGRAVRISVSVGVSILPPEQIDAEWLLDRADSAMYEAKRAGEKHPAVSVAFQTSRGSSAPQS